MSQMTSLTFRPPPNAEYVQGYPGIPPGGPDRPQAAVKGALEVRTGPQGVKAKWVRIELRKVETLPGGGTGSTFSDFVGPSPVNLWNASDEFSTLHSQNFSFLIRIPESIPPSISLENRAGIQYELVATVCTKGKRGFFRRRKTVVVNTQTDIFIDKHELHSTWPVYAQPESRQATNEGVTLIVDRNQTCYGPGDTISVHATLKSDNLHTVILRGFEFSLKETTIFRPGPLATSKKPASQAKTVVVAESKSAVNTTVFGGTQCSRDLVCLLPPDHTTTSLNSARHIDITYVLNVTARFGTGPPISLDLPVIISNWQRNVSMEAIRRIGPVPSLSLLPAQPQVGSPNLNATARLPSNATLPISQSTQPPQVRPAYNTAPVTGNAGYGTPLGRVDEFGGYTPTTMMIAAQPTSPSSTHGRSNSLAGSRSEGDRSTTTRGQMTTTPSMRFTVTNLPDSVENLSRNESVTRPRNGSVASTATGGGAARPWPSAVDEKERLYNEAKAKVERLQGRVDRVVTPPPQVATPPIATSQSTNRPGATSTPWPTAADEKLRLFNEAQAAVQRTQGLEPYTSPPHTQHTRSSSDLERARSAGAVQSGPTNAPTGAALFQQAMAARNEALQRQKSVPQPRTPPRDPPMPQYMTAEQEKAAYKRYEEAKRAVERVQYATYGSAAAPMGDALDEPPDDLPPPFEPAATSSSLPPSVLSEKEKLRRAYEERDAAAAAVAATAQIEPAPTYTSPPPPNPAAASSSIPDSALAEKERLRRKYEAQDAAALGRGSPPQPPPRSTSVGSQRTQRPTPVPPAASGSRILSAAEEKAMLRAKYAAEDAAAAPAQTPPRVNGTNAVAPPPVADHSGTVRPGSSSSSFYVQPQAPRHSPPPRTTASTGMTALQAPRNSPPTTTATTGMTAPQAPAASDPSTTVPPPLAPRPPVEYIRETREEDARVSRFVLNGLTPSLNDAQDGYGGRRHLEMSPFTPFSPGFDRLGTKAPGPPPPLPPKPAGE